MNNATVISCSQMTSVSRPFYAMYSSPMAHNLGYLIPHPNVKQGHASAGPANSKDIAIPMHSSHALTVMVPLYKLHFFLGIHDTDNAGCRAKRKEIRFGCPAPINAVNHPVRERGATQVNYCP
jgi:hypothetical protein